MREKFVVGAAVFLCVWFFALPDVHAQTVCTTDPAGIGNGSQSDITQVCYDPDTNVVSFSWDPVTVWNGGNTGDNCVFFDTDAVPSGNVDLAFCLSINGTAAGAVIAPDYPATFTCSDRRNNRCSSPVGPTPTVLSTCSLAIEATDPFGGADAPLDLRATCFLDPSEFANAVPTPTLSCAFNSPNPNSNPSNCITHNPVAAPALLLTKTAQQSTFATVGETVGYDYVVSNSGNTIFPSIAVSDDLIATVNCPSLGTTGLTPGQSTTCTATYVTTSSDAAAGSVTNTATASSGTTQSARASATVTYTGSPMPLLMGEKSVQAWDPAGLGVFSVPGAEVIYTISISNSGLGTTDPDTLFLVDELPAEVEFYTGDIDDSGPALFSVSFVDNGSGLDPFDFATDVGFSNGTTAPASMADCNYTPVGMYDPLVTFVCFNPKGSLAAGAPVSGFAYQFRARIR